MELCTRPVANPPLVDVHGAAAVQPAHRRRPSTTHEATKPARRPLPDATGAGGSGQRSADSLGIYRDLLLRQLGDLTGEVVRSFFAVDAAV